MAGLMKGARLLSQIVNRNPASVFILSRNHWNKDFKPAPFPKTQEERDAAAKKYNLLPEEYRPYADDGFGYGDYPKLPDIGVESKDPYYPYDFPEHKRNYNEPVHANIDLIGEDRYSLPEPSRYSTPFYYAMFLGVMGFCLATYYYLEDKKMFRPVVPKQYPGDGKVHYTFEPK
uniref:Putative mitochondrial electron transport nadh to ubiquinone n=1 Tax=Tabanus bromius TaxID=304241 RepID=A0A0K8TP44_TABBR